MANHLLLLALTIFNLHLVCVSPAPKTPPPPPPTTHPPPPLTTFKPPSPTTRPPPPPTFSPPPSKSFRPPPPQPSKTFPPPPPAKVFSSPPPPSISVSPPPQSTDFIPTPTNKAFSPPPPPPSATVSPPPPIDDGETTLEKIIDAITNNQTEFRIWANLLLLSTTPTTTTATGTLFIPSNAAFSHLPTPTTAAINFDPFLIPYHISPTRLSFHHLLHQFKPNSTIPTLLPSKSILITNTSPLNFTIDNSRITRPDIYLSPAFAVHGIQHILDYTLFGDLHFPATTSPPLIPPLDELVGATTTSDCSAAQLPLFSFLCGTFAFNMLLVN